MVGSIYGRAFFVGGIVVTGASATVRATGSMRAGGEPLALVAENMPAGQFSLFLADCILAQSPITDSSGILCMGLPRGRSTNDLAQTSAIGVTFT